jgi:DNA-binding MarR family transcriptional regulator
MTDEAPPRSRAPATRRSSATLPSNAAARAREDRGTRPAAPEWASDLDLPDPGLLARVIRLNLLVTRVLDGIATTVGIQMADHLVLGVLRRCPGRRSTPTHICELLGRSTGGMTFTLDRLEAAGWLTRSPDPVDRRRVVVTLTERGLEITARVNAALHAWEEGLGLDAEGRAEMVRRVDRLLGLFQERSAAEAAAAAGGAS